MITQTQAALVDVQPATIERYIDAHIEVEKRLGKSPGPEFLMSLVVERGDPMDLAESYCAIIVRELQKNS